MKGKYILIGSIILICGLIAYKLTLNKKELDSKKNRTTTVEINIPVKVAPVKDSLLELTITKTGTIIPFREAKVLAPVNGILKNLRFALGDQVKNGQVLAVVDDRTQQLDLQKAERNAAKLKSDLDTYSELLQGKATTLEKVNEIRMNYQDALTQVGQIRKNLSDAIIRSPSAGQIAVKQVESGTFVNAGNEIATIVDLSATKAEVFLSENEAYRISNGQSVEITTDVYPGAVFKGAVDFISPQADETRNYKTEVLIENRTSALLRSGTYVNVRFLGTKNENALLIPRETLTGSIREPSVFVVSKGKVQKRDIKTGIEVKGLIQVLEGLQAGELVVVSGQINLKDGSKVKVSQ